MKAARASGLILAAMRRRTTHTEAKTPSGRRGRQMRTTRIPAGLLIAAGLALVGGLVQPIGVDATHGDGGHALARTRHAGTSTALAGGGPVTQRGTPVLRTMTVGEHPGVSVVDSQTGRLFVANYYDNTVSVLDTATGTVVRTVDVGQATGAAQPTALTLDAPAGRVFVAAQDNSVTTLDARTGAVLRTVGLPSSPSDITADARSARVFVAIDNGTVSLLDSRTGALRSTVDVQGSPSGITIDTGADRVFVTSDEGTQGVITVLDAATGRVLRTLTVGGYPYLQLNEAAGTVFELEPRTGDTLRVLDATTGRVTRTVALGLAVYGTDVDARTGRVYAEAVPPGASYPFTGKVRLLALDARTGTVLVNAATDTFLSFLVVDSVTGHVLGTPVGPFNTLGNPERRGSLQIFNEATLAPLRTVRVGYVPDWIALDQTTQHVFVVNSNTDSDGNPRLVGSQFQQGSVTMIDLSRL
jgi:YVTN family beta-propeller protein